MKIRFIAAAVALAVATNVGAWESDTFSDVPGTHATEWSDKFDNTFLQLGFFPNDTKSCDAVLVYKILAEDSSAEDVDEVGFSVRIDRRDAWSVIGAAGEEYIGGHWLQTVTIGPLKTEFVREVFEGSTLRIAYEAVDGKMEYDRFSLKGSARAITEALTSCHELAQHYEDHDGSYFEQAADPDSSFF
jgi:hypothetical protein